MKSRGITALGVVALLAAPTWAQTTAPTSPAVGPSNPAVSPANPAVGPSNPAVGPSNPSVTRPANPPLATPGMGGGAQAGAVPFTRLDANHDGIVSQDELRADTKLEGVKFSDIDTNGDGKVSAEELTIWQRKEKTTRTHSSP